MQPASHAIATYYASEPTRGNPAMETSPPSSGKAMPEESGPAADLISNLVAESASASFGSRLRGVILIGSLARGEASIVWEAGFRKLLGDAEFLLVFSDDTPLPQPNALASFKEETEKKLARHGVSVKLDFGTECSRYLRRMQRSIYTYEVKSWGRVVWGDSNILALIPDFAASDIPREDAWRLLCNRIIEVLDALGVADVHAGLLSPALHYRTVKLYQDMATSYLVFAGCYEPAYRPRAERLARMAAGPQPASGLPFQLGDFSARVSACTRFKLGGLPNSASNEVGCPASADFLHAAVLDAHALWKWELAQLIGDQTDRRDPDLMRQWMRALPFRARIRGWAHVLRKCGWHRSLRLWPRWLRLAVQSSPRYCVYAAASQIFFELPQIAAPSHAPRSPDLDLGRIGSWLPVEHDAGKRVARDWWQVVRDVWWNYQEFLKDTQS